MHGGKWHRPPDRANAEVWDRDDRSSEAIPRRDSAHSTTLDPSIVCHWQGDVAFSGHAERRSI